MSNGPRFRSVLDDIASYRPGRPPARPAAPATDAPTNVSTPDPKTYKLSSNESPHSALPSVVQAIHEAARDINRYPDNAATELVGALATRFQVPIKHIAVGCGSAGVTQQLLEAVGEPGVEVLFAWRSFEAYPILVKLAGATPVTVPLRDEAHDLRSMAERITDRTRLIFVCNPNNPTGTVVRSRELEEFLDAVPSDCLVVLDEAYREYIRDRDVPDGLEVYRDRPNVAVLRTFSKAYGLAGMRVGFVVGHEPVAQAAARTQLPFTVNRVAQAAALASLRAEDELLARVELVVKERERVRRALVQQGWAVPPSEANFVWLRLEEQADDFAAACDQAGVSVRPFAGEGVRVTVGEPEANDIFLEVAQWAAGS